MKALREKVNFKTVFINFDDDKKMYKWKVFLGEHSFDYSMGEAYFTPRYNQNTRSNRFAKMNKKPKGIETIPYNSNGWLHCPEFKGVLYSLILDMQCGDENYQDFCDNYGYDQDSRKALKTYLACQENGNKLKSIFNNEELEFINSQLEEY